MTKGKLILPKLFRRWIERRFVTDDGPSHYSFQDMAAAYRAGYRQAQVRERQARLQEQKRRQLERLGLGG